jgi:hypothetical protein
MYGFVLWVCYNPIADWSPVEHIEFVCGRPESKPMPEITIVDNDLVEISNLYFEDASLIANDGTVIAARYTLSGTAANIGDRPISTLLLRIRVLDAQGRRIGSTTGFVVVHPAPWLMPGESKMWDTYITKNDNMESLSIELERHSFGD